MSKQPDAAESAAVKGSFWAKLRQRISLPEIESRMSSLRKVFLNGVFLLIVIVVMPVALAQFKRDQVIIEAIGVPETLAQQGFTGEVAASRVWDGLRDVALAANTAKESVVAVPQSRQVEFSFPDSGLSIESLIFHIRRLFNAYETRISGEIVCADADCGRDGMRLRLRIIRDRVDLVDLGPIANRTDREYFAEAASGLLAILDPFVAIAAASEAEPLKATILARRLIRGRHADSKWAYNLIGYVRANAGDDAAAIEEFKAALALDPAFLPARANLGDALVRTGDARGAEAAFDELRRRDPRSVRAANGNADIALASGDRAAAVRYLQEAARLDPLSPRYLAKAGRVEMEAGNTEAAIKLLTSALELDPGYLPAFAVLGAMHVANEDYKSAEPIYRDAADYAPEDAKAQAAHARILAILKDWEACAQRYAKAVALSPASGEYPFELARCLQRLGQHDQALAMLREALRLDARNADIHMSIGDSLRDLGRSQEAVAAYRTFLELAAPDAMMRPVAERFVEILSAESAPPDEPARSLYAR